VQHIESDARILGSGCQAVYARQVDERNVFARCKLDVPEVLFHSYAWKISHSLP
jgi:hypothetical protein